MNLIESQFEAASFSAAVSRDKVHVLINPQEKLTPTKASPDKIRTIERTKVLTESNLSCSFKVLGDAY